MSEFEHVLSSGIKVCIMKPIHLSSIPNETNGLFYFQYGSTN